MIKAIKINCTIWNYYNIILMNTKRIVCIFTFLFVETIFLGLAFSWYCWNVDIYKPVFFDRYMGERHTPLESCLWPSGHGLAVVILGASIMLVDCTLHSVQGVSILGCVYTSLFFWPTVSGTKINIIVTSIRKAPPKNFISFSRFAFLDFSWLSFS